MEYINDGAWYPGLDSISFQLGQGQYQWGQNITNRGGMIGTRQGFAQIVARALDEQAQEAPRGICLFSAHEAGVDPFIVFAVGSKIFYLAYPYDGEPLQLGNVSFPTTTRCVHFEVCVQAEKTAEDGSVIALTTPRFVLMMMDGITNPGYWYFDGWASFSGHTDPTAKHDVPTPPQPDTKHWNTPVGTFMKWAGDRLWVAGSGANKNHLYASDLLNPLQFEEQAVEASGGFFFLPGSITGIGVTHDYKSLLVYTDQTTSAFQAGIEDRTLWPQTQDFQRVLFPSIGCASHRTIINQYGMTWWESHDGVVALDSSLQAYQTSRMQVRDHNMSRSKEGISWADGGGCSGSFGNWLFFSNPSGSKDNVHTWVMDQAVQQNLNTITPPAWCSNWTGLRPEQWVTGTVNGTQRCFCISHDYVTTGRQATIWEAFIGQRMDIPKQGVLNVSPRLVKDIGCAFESKFMGLGPNQFIRFRYAELDLAEIVGTVKLQVYYCGRRTSYKKVLDKVITAQVTPSTEQIFDPEDLINVYVPQYRTVRTTTDGHDEDDADTGIQTPYIRSIDREFSLLVTWVGQMSITGLRMCVDVLSDYEEGVAEEDETTIRRITAEGTGEILSDPAPPNNFTLGSSLQSKYLAPLRPRWVEFPAYDSAVPNGVFFVDIPEFDPPSGGYPTTDYHPRKLVTITTETAGAQIVYTLDGTDPILNPLHGTIYTDPVIVQTSMVPCTIKARAYRDGLLTSSIATAVYSFAQVATPTYNPVPGAYPASEFPKDVTIVCATPRAGIQYVVSSDPDAHVTPLSPVYTAPVPVPAGYYLKAKGVVSAYTDSLEASGQYTAQPQCVEPTFAPDGGSYDPGTYPKSVTISTTTAGATLRYTKNDTDVQNGTVISSQTGVVSVDNGDTLRAIAQKTGILDSTTKEATYTVPMNQVEEPTLVPDGGEFDAGVITVTFHCTTPNATMAYNTGLVSDPPPDPTPDQPDRRVIDGDSIQLTIGHKIIKVIAFESGMANSTIHEAQFDQVHGG